MRDRAAVEVELAQAREQVAHLEAELASIDPPPTARPHSSTGLPLSAREYQRYGRQMILSAVGLPGTPWGLARQPGLQDG